MPIDALPGCMDTKIYYNAHTVSFGWDGSFAWGNLKFRKGKNVEFTSNITHNIIKNVDFRNLAYCKYLNLYRCWKIKDVDFSTMSYLKVLVIWHSGI